MELRLWWTHHGPSAIGTRVSSISHAISKIEWNKGSWKHCKLLHDLQVQKGYSTVHLEGKCLALKWNLKRSQACVAGRGWHPHIHSCTAIGCWLIRQPGLVRGGAPAMMLPAGRLSVNSRSPHVRMNLAYLINTHIYERLTAGRLLFLPYYYLHNFHYTSDIWISFRKISM